MNKTFLKKVYGAAVLASLLAPALVLAQGLPQPTPPLTGPTVGLTKIESVIREVATFLIAIALIIAVIFILWGGIMYMTAGADEAKASEAKSRIKNGIIGAAVVLAVGLILSTIAQVLQSGSLTF